MSLGNHALKLLELRTENPRPCGFYSQPPFRNAVTGSLGISIRNSY